MLFTNGTLSAMLNEFAVKFSKVSEESLGRDETPRQTCHELCFHKYSSIPIVMLSFTIISKLIETFLQNFRDMIFVSVVHPKLLHATSVDYILQNCINFRLNFPPITTAY